MKKPLIVLTGPTAAGKTHLSIALAKAVNGEIISADSMQVYKYMDIGSAKIRPEEMPLGSWQVDTCIELAWSLDCIFHFLLVSLFFILDRKSVV